MKILQPEEKSIVGEWIMQNGKVVEDESATRIKWLIEFYLKKIAGDGWEILYKDPRDGRYWELTYPHNDWHGAGPTKLAWLPTADAINKYKDSAEGQTFV